MPLKMSQTYWSDRTSGEVRSRLPRSWEGHKGSCPVSLEDQIPLSPNLAYTEQALGGLSDISPFFSCFTMTFPCPICVASEFAIETWL